MGYETLEAKGFIEVVRRLWGICTPGRLTELEGQLSLQLHPQTASPGWQAVLKAARNLSLEGCVCV